MRIKKLELIGFKSFKDRTVIQLDHGITGIVGPNGCGKSNIVDALVWVMGEMSAKHLRGSSMEDLIFAGAEGYAPVGMAEVSLTLENDGGAFPVKYLKHSEIMVTRRLHRSGETEYLINKEPARLRDIQEIFMDTGAGSKGFSIVEQGAIGRIVTSKPEERRTLIEEAAGITKFRARKKESQRKLKQTEQNLVRLQDIIAELKRQLDSLQRQAQKAERYRKLKQEVEDLEMWTSSIEYLALREKTEAAQTRFEEARDSLSTAEGSISTEEAQIQEMKVALSVLENKVNEEQQNAAQASQDVRDKEKHIQELHFETEQAKQRKEMTGSLVDENKAKEQVLETDLERVSQRLEKVSEEAKTLNENFSTKQEEFERVQERITSADDELTDARREMLTTSQVESSLDSKVQSLEEIISQSAELVEEAQGIRDELVSKQREFEKNRRNVFNELEEQRQLQMTLAEDAETLESQKSGLSTSIDQKRVEVQEFKDRLNEVTSRLYGLENLQDNFEGFQEGVKSVMFWQKEKLSDLSEEDFESNAYFKPFAEVVEVPKQYEIAMESALGPRLQMLLSSDNQTSLEAVQYLKEKNTGRSSFLSPDMMVVEESEETKLKMDPRVDCLLADVIKAPERYKDVVNSLLTKIAVVQNIESAIEIHQNYKDWTFVSVDGDIVSADGTLTAGASSSADSGVLKRRREIKELSIQKDEWAGKLALAQESLTKLETEFDQIQRDLEAAVKKTTDHEILLTGLKKDLERADNEVQNAQTAVSRQENELRTQTEKKSSREAELAQIHEELVELREKKLGLEEKTEQLSKELEECKQGIGGLTEEVTQLKVESATKNQEFEGLNREHDMLSRSLDEVKSSLSRMNEETDRSSETISSNSLQMEEQKNELNRMIDKVQVVEKTVAELRDKYEQDHAEMRTLEESIMGQREEKSSLQGIMNEAQLELEQNQMKEKYIAEQMYERYMVQISEVAHNYKDREGDPKEEESRLKSLKEKINRIGEVNLSAIEEYDGLTERYEFLKKQHDDLVDAKSSLGKVIDRINRICSQRFKQTFEAVNDRFTKVFPVLFGGGEARLILVEDPEKEEVGIDIVAKPPGKKAQSVMLLSGGEKALTAVSLIFSIFLVKPSPYCLLDEVDAPLDDANVMRFNELVREMAKRSQIIVVTHNKHTMEVANKLFGVTQEEKGVSKMVSVNLDQAQSVVE